MNRFVALTDIPPPHKTKWVHKICGGDIVDVLRYSDAEHDYYFPTCNECCEGVELKDVELKEING